MKRFSEIIFVFLTTAYFLHAQTPVIKVDLNMSGRTELECNDPNYVAWIPDNAVSTSKTISGVTFTFKETGSGSALKATWYKAGLQAPSYARLGCDGMFVDGGNAGAQIELTISGLPTGTHSFMAFHNALDDPAAYTFSPLDISVNGTAAVTGLVMSKRALTTDVLQSSYVTFNATAGKNVVILYKAQTSGSATMKNVYINGFELNTPNVKNQSKNPIPLDGDLHVDADTKTAVLKWTAGTGAVSHRVYFSTDQSCVTTATPSSACYMTQQTATSYSVGGLYSMNTYYWRVDEVSASGVVTKGNVWVFRPRQLAFPGAEGYGRFATGGRGGKVVHVTNLNDSGTGSLRDAVENQTGARTIVFDVGGIIVLNSRLVLSDPNVTIAGQTAPGNGICLRTAPFGFTGNDVIARFIRLRLGAGPTYDGMGMTGANHTIMDHCSISWTIDESFSSRSGKNITLQRTLISEALNAAGHQNYPPGTEHGYAATIGGDVGSFHHNLLAHNYGRNWSMGGGLDGNAYYAGRLDITNNVVYNWGGRTTDGGAMEVNFVNNYYKPGAGSKVYYALTINHEGTGLGMQRAYFNGNVMPGHFNESSQTSGRTETYTNGDYKKYEGFVSSPFFPSYVTTQTAYDAYKSVLSDVGASQPFFDIHDTRMITETLNGTYSVTGSVTGKPGFPDKEADAGGYESYPTTTRPSNWDSDGDGMPNFWETAHGTNPNSGSGNFTESNEDPDKDGYTRLEDYLNWMADPHYMLSNVSTQTINLTNLFRGYSKTSPVYTSSAVTNGSVAISGSTLTFTKVNCGMASFKVTVRDADGATMTRTIGVYVDGNCGTPPVVNLTAPLNSTSVCLGTAITLTATATATNSTISKIDFYNGTTLLGTDNSSPYSFTYTPTAAGTLSLRAVATDNEGLTGTSATNTVTVKALPSAVITNTSGTVIPYGGNIVLSASTGTGYTYQWKNGTTAINGATTATYTATVAGSYSVTVTANACSATSAATVLTAETPPLKYIYNYDNSGNLSWINTNSWTPKAVPRAIDTVVVRTGEVQINALTHTAPVYVETNGVLRLVTANSTVNDIHLQGGTLRIYTSTPELALTGNIKVESPSTIIAGSVAATVFTLNGTISGSADITKTGVGVLRLNSDATAYKGNWIVTEGKLQVRSANALGLCGVQVKSGARLDIEAAASIYSLKIEAGGGIDLDNTLASSLVVLDAENMVAGSYTNAARPTFIGGTSILTVGTTFITSNGDNQLCSGETLQLQAAASSSYQWKNGINSVGTSASYTVNAAGNYSVKVTNSNACAIESAPLAITLASPPAATITAASATTICAGASVVLNANTGTGLTYQWKNASGNISGATAASYTATAAGSYSVSVSNGNCAAVSAATTVTVNAAATATITAASGTTFCQGGSVVLNANTGTGFTYQWKNTSGNISGATAASYTATTSESYSVVVNNGSCSATSAATTVTINTGAIATITAASSTTFCQGGSVVLNANTGTGLTYQWKNAAGNISGATTASYTANTSDSYSVVVSNGNCSATSAATIVTVNTAATALITAASATTFCQGGSVILNANTGTGFTYQWKNASGNISGATNASYTASISDAYSVVVSNGNCSAVSAATTVSVHPPVSVAISPSGNVSLNPGASITFTASTTATDAVYTWFKGTTQIGTNTNVITVSGVGNYSVRITSGPCLAVSNVATVIQAYAPSVQITTPAANISFVSPAGFVLHAQATDADGTITKVEFYQNNTKVGEATSEPFEFSVAGLQTGNYIYHAIATDNSGLTTTSSDISVTVTDAPVPQVDLSAVYNQSTSGSGTGNILITASISGTSSSDISVEVYDGTTLLATLTQAPYEYLYNNPAAGIHQISVKVSDGAGNTVTQTQTVDVQPISTSISSQNTLKVICYPNPYTEIVYVELDGSCYYRIEDMAGRLVESGTINLAAQIGSGLASGQYIVVLQAGDKQTILKIEKR